jgi:hypothetical protein
MKRLLLFMLLSTVAVESQTQNYTASTASFPNPERGYYHYSSTGTSTYQLLSQSTLSGYRNENISVIHRTFYLNNFITSPISATYLANMQADFTALRNAGLKVIIRFAYSKSESAAALDATKTQILAHIAQVASIIQANRDVISIYQYGWIGCWGETYYTSQVSEFGNADTNNLTTAQWANRKQVIDAMLAATPVEIPVQVRYVTDKQKMYPNGNNRIGFYNDAFLNAWGDSGTFNVSGASGTPTAADSNYLQAQTALAPMAGETDGLNAPRTDCANAMLEMDKYNWSMLNKDYLTAIIANWQSQGCFSETERRLGYRFELLNSTISGNTLTLKLQNSGYANIFKERKAYLVLRNIISNVEYSFQLNTDLRNWLSNTQTQISQSLDLEVPAGSYKLFLNLPDSQTSNPLYSIQCANIGTWDAAKGYNNLNQTVTIGTGQTSPPLINETAPITIIPPLVTIPVNPVQVQIILQSNNVIGVSNLPSTTFTVAVYNSAGKLKATTLDMSGLRRGIYIVKITCNGTVYTQSVSKGNNN